MNIKKILNPEDLNISDFNALLDEGNTWDENQARLFLDNPTAVLFVAFEGERAIGFVSAYRLQRFDQRKAEVLIYEVGVDESYRQQGVGKALIMTVKNWALEVGANEAWVLTEKDNHAARALYASVGGEEDGPNTTMFSYQILPIFN